MGDIDQAQPTARSRLRSAVTAASLVQVALLVAAYAMWAATDRDGWVEPKTASVMVAMVGAACMVGSALLEKRPLDCSSDRALLGAWATAGYLRLAAASGAGLVGFIGMVASANPFVQLIGSTLALMGLALVAPTAGNIERIGQWLDEQSCRRDLAAIIDRPLPPAS